MDSVEFLDAVRARHKLTSDNKLAAFLQIPQGRVSLYRTGARKLDPDACLKVAKALDLPPEHVFAAVQAERAKRTEHRRVWERLAKLAKHAGAAAVVGFIASTSTPTSSHATELNAQQCILCPFQTVWVIRGSPSSVLPALETPASLLRLTRSRRLPITRL